MDNLSFRTKSIMGVTTFMIGSIAIMAVGAYLLINPIVAVPTLMYEGVAYTIPSLMI